MMNMVRSVEHSMSNVCSERDGQSRKVHYMKDNRGRVTKVIAIVTNSMYSLSSIDPIIFYYGDEFIDLFMTLLLIFA